MSALMDAIYRHLYPTVNPNTRWIAQVSTKRWDDSWTGWITIGASMNALEADLFMKDRLNLQARFQNIRWRMICVPMEYPNRIP